MKKLIIILLFLSSKCVSQNQKDEKQIHLKNVKTCLVLSGSFIVAGSIINVIKTYQKMPDNLSAPSNENYIQKQKNLSRVSSMFYGLAGVPIICIAFNF